MRKDSTALYLDRYANTELVLDQLAAGRGHGVSSRRSKAGGGVSSVCLSICQAKQRLQVGAVARKHIGFEFVDRTDNLLDRVVHIEQLHGRMARAQTRVRGRAPRFS